MKNYCIVFLLLVLPETLCFSQTDNFSKNPSEVRLHTEDIINFWKVFDFSFPNLKGSEFDENYIKVGSAGLKGFINMRIESGSKLASTVKKESDYYTAIRESSLSIDKRKDRFYECFNNLKKIYPDAVFPDVYFVIGRKNSGGTTFKNGLIIGAEMFGKETETFKPILDIEYVDEVVAHELVHFQQNYAADKSLLAQSIREGAADFICELIAGDHSNKKVYQFGDEHKQELWDEFQKRKDLNDWSGWLYSSKDKNRPNDLGYWMGYQITKAYYDKQQDKAQAIKDILNIKDFKTFFIASGYNGQ